MFIAIAAAILMLLGIAVILFVYIRVQNNPNTYTDYDAQQSIPFSIVSCS
jgi:hypothetical protein